YLGTNQLSQVAGVIQQYDALTKAGGGAPCYTPYNGSPGVADPTCAATSIVNPYYNQPYVNPYSVTPTSGWYPIAATGLNATDNPTQYFEDVPLESTIILNYRKDRLAITPSLQLAEGSSYGGPFDVNGIDPRMCAANQATDGVADPQGVPAAYGVAGAAATNCDYWELQGLNGAASAASAQLFIPNPQTGQFATLGQYREPWILVGNIQLSYDFSPRLTGIITVADLFHDCFGGSKEPWTTAYAPGSNVCGYYPSSLYVSNFYNGSSPYDTAANGITPYPWQTNSYAPSANYSEAGGIPAPLNVYFQLRVRM
ncbi:MAG TPA: hypothetical protein VMD47_11135, partial [Candidatus Acidoferrales bacterium]|nr:hypothetical protein [Candidatus Acidoferrales bacterium]